MNAHDAEAFSWLETADQLLAEPHPGETPFLVEDLIVDGAVAQLVGPPKKGKTYVLLDLAIAVAAGGKALGRFAVPNPGPVLLVLEESGRAALHRRLDLLARGRAIKPNSLSEFHYSANRRVKLDDEEWRNRLRKLCGDYHWRLIAFDPYARLKGGTDEDNQRESGPILDFLRELRELSSATVLYVAHTGHEGTRQRGSSDFESYYESKLTLIEKGGKRTLSTDHREAEATGPYELAFRFDGETRTLRIDADDDELAGKVREHLEQHPDDSANAVFEAIGGSRAKVLELVKQLRDEGGTNSPVPPRTTTPGQSRRGGTTGGAYEAPGTTPGDPPFEVVPTSRYHCSHDAHWIARDGLRRCAVCDPPAFPSEVVA